MSGSRFVKGKCVMGNGSVVVVGGTGGIGKQLARHYAASGEAVVITGRDQERATAIAAELGPNVAGIGFDLGEPAGIGPTLCMWMVDGC